MNSETAASEHDRPRDDEILAFHHAIRAADAEKLEFVGEKEPLSVLAVEYEAGNPVFRAKVEKLGETYGAIRRARGDGNCFFRSFMFSYLEHILETKDEAEVARVLASIEQCKNTLVELGYAEFTFEDFLSIFVEQLESVRPGRETSISLDTLVEHCRDRYISDYEIRKRAEFFEPFVLGLSNMNVQQVAEKGQKLQCYCRVAELGFGCISLSKEEICEIIRSSRASEEWVKLTILARPRLCAQFASLRKVGSCTAVTRVDFCKTSVEPMGEESDHVHITALSDALGVPVRVVYLDRSGGSDGKSAEVNHHDFLPADSPGNKTPTVVLLYRPGHYDILYSK